ncbi:P-loop containing nucleoside triphosphate hydrolase protein, partial [Daedalea quercina L-15889]
MCCFQGYASLLGIISVIFDTGTAKLATRHLALVLAFTWAVFIYRDIWPLTTFTLQPADRAEGGLLWAKFAVLTIAGVAVPLLVPRQYTPADPKNPWKPIPEQTASLLSMMLYLWLDPTVFEAYRVPHLPIERLPPLADYDSASHLVKRSFKHLDPFMVKNPLGIKNLLGYLETDGEGAVVRPWVWISWLFIGPMIGSVALQWYIFTTTRMLVRTTGIITQLVFAHALRIRLKAEVPDTPASSTVTTAVGTPDNASEDETARASTISSSTKGKGKSKVSSEGGESRKEGTKNSEDAKGANLVGKINNLVTTDLDNLINGRDFLFIVVEIPLQLGLCIWFLYAILGWRFVCDVVYVWHALMLLTTARLLIQTVQIDKMKKTDIRVQSVTESMNVIRMIKLFGWEPRVKQQLEEKREDELYYQWKYRLLGLINGCLKSDGVCRLLCDVRYGIRLSPFARRSLRSAVFDLLRNSLNGVFGLVPAIIRAKVSLDRVDEFLKKTELLDEYSPDSHEAEALIPKTLVTHDIIGVRNSAFTWMNVNHGLSTPVSPGTPGRSRRNFVLRIEDEVQFKRGHINLIVGPTGSGKTSLLMALLGEMHYIPHGPDSYYHLPRAGGVAYAAQESWVQNETIRARITLARAVYSSAEILLLDDVLAALDVHTAKWIVDKCFKGDLIRSRTTHNVAMASPVADFVVSLGTDGQVVSQGSMSKVLAKDEVLLKEIDEENMAIEKAEHTVDNQQPAEEGKKSDGKLVVAEEISVGHVSWPALKMFFSSLGGSQQSIFW